jgi:HD-GYP domain-containing protein (c-di-GMP phosphodiesterase class II)
MGMSDEEVDEIRTVGLLHDLGKMSIPAEILSKPGRLSRIELELIKGHSEAGYTIISGAHLEGAVAEVVHQHHERCDGSGYPRGLTGDELLPGAKVVAVADVVEAMMSHRPYRPGLGLEAALAEIDEGGGSRYDIEVAKACSDVFRVDGFEFAEDPNPDDDRAETQELQERG